MITVCSALPKREPIALKTLENKTKYSVVIYILGGEGEGEGGGGRGYLTKVCTGMLHPEFQTLTLLYITFDQKRKPISHSYNKNPASFYTLQDFVMKKEKVKKRFS